MASYRTLSTAKQLCSTYWRDVLRSGLGVLGPAAVLFFWAQYFEAEPEILQSMTWLLVSFISVTQTTVGKTAKKSIERSMGTIAGGVLGFACALTRSPAVLTAGCCVAAMIGEFIMLHLKLENTGKLFAATYVIVSTATLHARFVWLVAIQRIAAVLCGVALCFCMSLLWFPAAASQAVYKHVAAAAHAAAEMSDAAWMALPDVAEAVQQAVQCEAPTMHKQVVQQQLSAVQRPVIEAMVQQDDVPPAVQYQPAVLAQQQWYQTSDSQVTRTALDPTCETVGVASHPNSTMASEIPVVALPNAATAAAAAAAATSEKDTQSAAAPAAAADLPEHVGCTAHPPLSSVCVPIGVLLKLQGRDEAQAVRQQQLTAYEDGMIACALRFREALVKISDAVATSDNEVLVGHLCGRPVYLPRFPCATKHAAAAAAGSSRSGVLRSLGPWLQLQQQQQQQQDDPGSDQDGRKGVIKEHGSSSSSSQFRQLPRQAIRRVLVALRGSVHVWWCLHFLLMQGVDEADLAVVLSSRYPSHMLDSIRSSSRGAVTAVAAQLQHLTMHQQRRCQQHAQHPTAAAASHACTAAAAAASVAADSGASGSTTRARQGIIHSILTSSSGSSCCCQDLRERVQQQLAVLHQCVLDWQGVYAAADRHSTLSQQPRGQMEAEVQQGQQGQGLSQATPLDYSKVSKVFQIRWHALHELVVMLEQELIELAAATQQLMSVLGCI